MIFSRIYNLITESSDAMKITLKYTTRKDTTSLQHQKDIAPTRKLVQSFELQTFRMKYRCYVKQF